MTKVGDWERLSYSERELVEAALEFANLRRFNEPRRPLRTTLRTRYRKLKIDRSRPETEHAISRAHGWAFRALQGLAKTKPESVKSLEKPRVGSLRLADVRIVAIPRVEGSRIQRADEAVIVGSVSGLCAYAIALIAAGHYRLAICKLEECQRFFIPRPSPRGRYVEYCCPQHKRAQHGQ